MITDIEINGKRVPSPEEWLPSYMDLVSNSNRVGGVTMRFNYLATKRQWQAKWTNLTKKEYETLLGAFEGVSFFTIKCYDPREKDVVTKTFYKGDRTFDSMTFLNNEEGYGSFSVTFIEK